MSRPPIIPAAYALHRRRRDGRRKPFPYTARERSGRALPNFWERQAIAMVATRPPFDAMRYRMQEARRRAALQLASTIAQSYLGRLGAVVLGDFYVGPLGLAWSEP
jgi:hypothetical protein